MDLADAKLLEDLRYYVIGRCRHLNIQDADAQDMYQDVIQAAVQPGRSFSTPKQLFAFAGQTITNLRYNMRRRRSRVRLIPAFADDPAIDPSSSDSESDSRQKVKELLELISDASERIAVELRFYNGMKIEEVASHLGIPPTSAHRKILSGLAELRAKLNR